MSSQQRKRSRFSSWRFRRPLRTRTGNWNILFDRELPIRCPGSVGGVLCEGDTGMESRLLRVCGWGRGPGTGNAHLRNGETMYGSARTMPHEVRSSVACPSWQVRYVQVHSGGAHGSVASCRRSTTSRQPYAGFLGPGSREPPSLWSACRSESVWVRHRSDDDVTSRRPAAWPIHALPADDGLEVLPVF